MIRKTVLILVSMVTFGQRAWAAGESEADEKALARYQQCFQKMIDANVTDNAFMRRCLGLGDKPVPKKGPKGSVDFVSKDAAAKALAQALPAIKTCYETLLAQTKDLGLTPEGSIESLLKVTPDGKVAETAFQPGTLTDVTLLACVKDRLKSVVFPKTTQEGPFEALVSLRLATAEGRRAEVALAKDAPKLSGPAYEMSGKDAFNVFRKNSGALRKCYDELIKRQPAAAGAAAVELAVTAKGRVGKVTFRELSVGDAGFKACLSGELKSWVYPPSRSGDPTTVRYPSFQFAPQPAAP